MAIQLGSAYGKVVLDASGVQKGVGQATTSLEGLAKVGLRVGEALASVGRGMTIGLTLPIAAIGAASVKMASDLTESQNKVRVVFGDMSDSILAWSKTSANALGQSQAAALEAAGTFGNLFTTMGLGQEQSAEMSMRLVELASDLASFNNIDPGVALEKLQSGLVGETRAVRDLGINLLDSTVKAKAMQMGLADASGALSQQALVMARYQLILEQSTNAQGDFARTSGEFANQIRILRANMVDFNAVFGSVLKAAILPFLRGINGVLESFLKLPPRVQAVIAMWATMGAVILAAAGPILWATGTIISAVSNLALLMSSGAFAGFATTITTLVTPALGGLGTALGTVGATITTTVVPALGAVAAAALPVIVVILTIVAALALLAAAWKGNFAFMRDNIRVFATSGKLLWAGLMAFIRGDTATATADVRAAWAVMVNELQARIEKYAPWLMTIWAKTMNMLQTGAVAAVKAIIAVFNIDWWRLGQAIIQGIINGFVSGIGSLISIVVSTLKAVLAQMAAALDAGSPSRKTHQLGVWAGQGFMQGFQASMSPEIIARMVAQPVAQSSHTQQYNTLQIGSGVTLQEVDRRIAVSAEEIMSTLASWLEGR